MTVEPVITAAQDWATRLPARAAEFERERRLPADIADGFGKAGFFHMLVPAQYGGLEVHPRTFVQVLKTLARGDASASWNAMIGSTTGLLSASLPDAAVTEIFGDKPGGLAVGVTAPNGKAEIVADGFKATGRWPFGSGSQNASWICGGCFIYQDGQQVMSDKGQPEVRLLMFKAANVVIEDTWKVSGLRGTGSHHFHVDDVFVPESHTVSLGGRARVDRPLYQFPMLGLLALGVASVSVGVGYRAVDAFLELAGDKKPTGSTRQLGDRALVQSNLAKSLGDLRSAEALMNQSIDDAWAIAESGERLPQESKAALRLAAANATHASVRAVDRLYEAGGGSSIYEDNPLQQCFRDVHVTTQHAMVAEPIFEVVGRVELGLPPRSLL